MKKRFTFNKEKETVKESSSKRSIMLRWAFANTVFCFITFTLFATLIYQLAITTFINEERSLVLRSMDDVEDILVHSSEELTSENLHEYIDFVGSVQGHIVTGAGGRPTLESMLGSRKSFYIYGTRKNLIYGTNSVSFGLKGLPDNQSREYEGEHPGFLVERKIVSKTTGKTVGYLQSFYDMSAYHKISNLLLVALLILEVLALIIAQIIGYFMANHFMKPLEKLHRGMQEMAADPTAEFKPIEIKTGDEIEELAHVYNDLMIKTNDYLDQQKRFVSDVSHELRTPLAVLDGHINLLNRWGKNDPEILDESLQASLFEVKRMKKMLEEMLALARLENVDLSSEGISADVSKVCGYAVKNFQMLHEDFEITLNNELSAPVFAKISESHYEQGLRILLDNAAKYSPDEPKRIKITLALEDEEVITMVSDQGIGIDSEDVDHLFERFFRVDKARNRDIGGTGLGLPILARLAENYKGEIIVDSELGAGTTFSLKLPIIK